MPAIELTEGEIILLRSAVRLVPPSSSLSIDYAEELRTSDNKLTEALAELFDQRFKPGIQS